MFAMFAHYKCDVSTCRNEEEIETNVNDSTTTGPDGWAWIHYNVFGGSIEQMHLCETHRKAINAILFPDRRIMIDE